MEGGSGACPHLHIHDYLYLDDFIGVKVRGVPQPRGVVYYDLLFYTDS